MKLKLHNLSKWLLMGLLFICFQYTTKASHIMGGEFTYRYLYTASGVVYYETKLVMYLDCISSIPFSNPVTMGIYAGTNFGFLGSREVYMSGMSKDVTPQCGAGNMCIEEAAYIDTFSLADAQKFGVYITCGATDRNNNIANLDLTYGSKGSAWQIYIPAPKFYINNSPQFATSPITKGATKTQTRFAANAYDIDGDSLVYSLVQPYGSTGGSLGSLSGYPVQVPLANLNCTWANGYSLSKPLGANGSTTIDSLTGEITATIPQANSYVLVVQIDEYRKLANGAVIYMGETRRDFEIRGFVTPNYTPPIIHDLEGTTNKTIYANRNNCFNISATDSLGDTITITAAGIMFDTSVLGQQHVASFDEKTSSGKVTQQFCWQPECNQTRNTPYILTIDVLDKNCNHTQKNFSLTVEDLLVDTITTSVCTGSSYNFNGKMLNTAGMYSDSFAKSACNNTMIQVLMLSLGKPNSSIIYDSICEGEVYTLVGKKITTSGTYTDTAINMGGCDSAITLHLASRCCSYHIIYDTICYGTVYDFYGKKINKTGSYIETFKRTNGCDSFIELQLYTMQSFSLGTIIGNQAPLINDTSTYSINGAAYNDYNWYVTGGQNISGQGTNTIKVLWSKMPKGSIAVSRNCSRYSILDIVIINSVGTANNQPEITIYPNPNQGTFNINFGSPLLSTTELSIYNTMGQKLYNSLLQNGTNQCMIELENKSAGCYYIHIKSADDIIVKQFIVTQ